MSRGTRLLTAGVMVGLFGPAVMTGPQGSFFAELFGTRLRYTGASLGFQFGAALIGGMAPVVAAGLVLAFGSLMPVGVFMVALGIATVACVGAAADTRPEKDPNDAER